MDHGVCDYYLLCYNKAEGTTDHPILGDVETCKRCADKHDLELREYDNDNRSG